MLPFGVTVPATVPQGSEMPEGLMNNPVHLKTKVTYLKGGSFFVRRINYVSKIFDKNSFQKFVKILYPRANRHLTWTFLH